MTHEELVDLALKTLDEEGQRTFFSVTPEERDDYWKGYMEGIITAQGMVRQVFWRHTTEIWHPPDPRGDTTIRAEAAQ